VHRERHRGETGCRRERDQRAAPALDERGTARRGRAIALDVAQPVDVVDEERSGRGERERRGRGVGAERATHRGA
jgi:hypothetical protein